MKQNRECKNAIDLTYYLLRYIHDRVSISHKELRMLIIKLYSDNEVTINNHIKILLNSGFIKIGVVPINNRKYKFYYFERK